MLRTHDGETLSEEEWSERAHEVVFDALERSLEGVEFPRSRDELLEAAGERPVLDQPRVPLQPYLETLPRREFRSEAEVAEALDRTWQRADASRFGL